MPAQDSTGALANFVKALIRKHTGAFSSHVQATFVAADTADSNLSTITVYGKTISRVRKTNNVGAMTAGQQLLCLQGGGTGVVIIGILVGNVT